MFSKPIPNNMPPPPPRMSRMLTQPISYPPHIIVDDDIEVPPSPERLNTDLTFRSIENDSPPPPPALTRQASNETVDRSASMFGSPPAMIRQVSVDMTDYVALEAVRTNGLYKYLETIGVRDWENIMTRRYLILAHLEYLDLIDA